MLARLGFVASVLAEGLSTSRTCRLRNANEARIRELIVENLEALGRVVSFLEAQRILLYRISSNLIPFASHPVNTLRWWEDYAGTLAGLGARMRKVGIRVSTHPGQYTVLNSPHTAIVQSAAAELTYHARLLDALGMDTSCKIVVHTGGLYGGSERDAMNRFISTVRLLPDGVRRRLVVENDDRLFDAGEVLEVSLASRIPAVFDWLHHQANPCPRSIVKVLEGMFGTWGPLDGPPKVHLSSQSAAGPAGAHADYVEAKDFLAFLCVAPEVPFDCMIEAKQKDRALLRLRRQLARCGIVERALDSSRPAPARASTLQRRRR